MTTGAAQAVSGRQVSGSAQRLVLQGVFVVLLALGIGHAGPYGTYEAMPVLQRMLYWTAIIMLPWALFQALLAFGRRMLPNLSPLQLTALIMPAFAIVGSAVTLVFNIALGQMSAARFLSDWSMSIAVWLGFSFLIILPLQIIGATLAREQRQTGGAAMLDFLKQKLPVHLRAADLIAMGAEDHYVRVFTSDGDTLIHMRFGDAVSALEGYNGVQTQRSWWIALDQVEADTFNSRLGEHITMVSGLKVPVSRRKRASVRSALKAFSNG
ncbi:MAG: LytTR family DNA-binding domain-containing protein [Pseudomonadota bacterium]